MSPPPIWFLLLPVFVSASGAESRVVRFRFLPLSRDEVRSYRSARASGAPLLCSVPTDLLHPSLFMGDPGSVPGGTEGPESHISPRHDGTAHDMHIMFMTSTDNSTTVYNPYGVLTLSRYSAL